MRYQEPEMTVIQLQIEGVIRTSGGPLTPTTPPTDPWNPGDGEVEINF